MYSYHYLRKDIFTKNCAVGYREMAGQDIFFCPKVASSVGQRINMQTNIYNVMWPGAS